MVGDCFSGSRLTFGFGFSFSGFFIGFRIGGWSFGLAGLFTVDRFVLGGDDQSSFADLECRLDRFGDSRADPFFGGQPIDDDFDVVAFGAIEVDLRSKRNHLAINAGAGESLFQ